jgi:hypothetical protein
MSSTPFSYDEVLESEAPDSAPVDEQTLASLLNEYVHGPAPGPTMGTFDGDSIELTEENLQYIAEAAAAAGRGLTVKGKRRQHYMTHSTTPWHYTCVGCEHSPRDPSPWS